MSRPIEGLTQAAVLFAIMLFVTALGMGLVRRWRGRMAQGGSDPHTSMSKFRDLHARGGLSDEEFRTIKAKLASELRAELKDNGNAG